MTEIQILLTDDHDIVRDGIRALLEDEIGFAIAAEASNGAEAVETCNNTDIDLAIMDISMPKMDGIEATRQIKNEHPDIKVLALTMMGEDQHIRQMIEAGASGYILKSSDQIELIDAITSILNGQHYFSNDASQSVMMDLVESEPSEDADPTNITDREREVLELIVDEHTNQQIAEELYISVRTVDSHRRNLLQKTGAKNTAGLVTYAIKNNLVDIT
ncbi:two component transcriptional regulator, LuxR family [Fodinibius salinus]|uniref:Two component transcriptional regulator, LuxR family n=1 Tax=Fodinibius salinus TaxID=860790 RepID=A0A5D3YIL9_9BACT|nr:response regulator transcription factor [Fodinibius salinus]TYP92154.1 two component transcriptional regulator, LuxR family [Fodinibius salinus]